MAQIEIGIFDADGKLSHVASCQDNFLSASAAFQRIPGTLGTGFVVIRKRLPAEKGEKGTSDEMASIADRLSRSP